MNKEKGVITVYLSVTWAVLLSLIVTLVNASSMAAVKVKAECALENSLNSVFAEYNRELWNKYNLLYIDISYESNSPAVSNLEKRINDYYSDNLYIPEDERFLFVKDLLGITEGNVTVTEIEYATDRWGDVFFDQVCSYAKDVTGTDVINNMNNLVAASSSYDFLHSDYDHRYVEAVNAVNEGVRDGGVLEDFDVTTFFPDLVPNMEDTAVTPMGMVILGTDYYKLSFNRVQILNLASHDYLKESGNMGWDDNSFGLLDDIYFNEYVMNKFNNYRSEDAESPLKYETEYIIHGSGNDANNISAVTNYIFLIRAGCNTASVYMDKEKMDLIKAASKILSPLTKCPPEVWQALLALAWGGMEGVADTREIVIKGEKVPIIKDGDDFTTSFKGIINLIISKAEGVVGIEESSEDSAISLDEDSSLKDLMGIEIGYTDYLRLLLYMVPRPIRIFRTMDLIELNIRETPGNEFFKMNGLVARIAVEVSVLTKDNILYSAKRKYSYF